MKWRVGLAFVCVTACGAGDSQRSSVAMVIPTSHAPSDVVHAQKRGPSEAFARAWPLETPDWIAYADWPHLAQGALFASIAASLASIANQALDPRDAAPMIACAQNWIAHAREVAFGTRSNAGVLLARFDSPPSLDGCLKQGVLRASGNFLVWATNEALASRALDPPAHASPSPLDDVRLEDGAQVAIEYFREPRGEASVSAHEDRFAAIGFVTFRESSAADDFERDVRRAPDEIKKALASFVKPEDAAHFEHMLHAFHVERQADRVRLSVDLHEDVAAQIADFTALANMAAEGVRKYIVSTKMVEAYATVDAIARDIVVDWERETLPPTPFAKKKLRSFPATPKTVPRGVKWQSSPDDWKPWSALRFQIDQPQYYQYEVRAARDGKSAEVIAHGDLNGDGKTSTFSLALTVDPATKTLRIAPAPQVTDPEE